MTNPDSGAAASAALASQGGTPVRATFLPVALPWIGEREKQLVLESLDSGWITTGPKTQLLAERIAGLSGAKHAVVVNSATGALHLALEALGLGPGDEVITSTYTFVATVNVIEHVRATTVLVDVEPDTLNLDPRRGRGRDHAAHEGHPDGRLRRPPVRVRRACRRSPTGTGS